MEENVTEKIMPAKPPEELNGEREILIEGTYKLVLICGCSKDRMGVWKLCSYHESELNNKKI